MAYSVAYQHTDSNRNYDGSNLVYGVKKVGTDRKSASPLLYYVTCEVWVKMNNTQNHLVFCRIFTIFALKKRENSIMKKRTRDLKD